MKYLIGVDFAIKHGEEFLGEYIFDYSISDRKVKQIADFIREGHYTGELCDIPAKIFDEIFYQAQDEAIGVIQDENFPHELEEMNFVLPRLLPLGILALLPDDVKEKLEKMREQFVKENSAERKPTANQTENVGFKADILTYLATVDKATITDLMKNVASLADLSNQRVSAIVRQLKDSGEVVREEIKRKAYFSKA